MVAGRLLCVRRGGAGVLRNRGAAVVGRAERHQWKRCACLRVPQRPSSTTACAQHRQARRQHHQPADDDVNKAAASSGPALHEAEEEDGGVRECIRSIVDNGEMKAVGVTPGLFTNMRLLSSDGFPVIEEEARAHMNALVREMKDNHSRGHHEKALESVDHISHVLCKVLDLCEFVLQVHPSAEYRDAAANSLYSLGHDMEVLNTDVELYQALKAFEDMPSAVEVSEPPV
ncbi:hypothetical protein PTSG_07408 [Salpingoeca rosetta]|uniref:Uncharacterized protein n=1 Tax=Salpingoeca rosetta (strain ATCC 50818 / BSB-021) TaxID=946362 RepID=F2UIL9_SALR5|nr:uncharacterized protein PTSG_07408 [Salpingoeca rosetta]EGD77068.1 hypothetical protein PTSG_07408 [Salpingoeca rosetta]|eukprot:XP_004990908.1 hypothetical protein PTSG_07408 [Salpingoeca rosetta]